MTIKPYAMAELSRHLDHEIKMVNGAYDLFYSLLPVLDKGGAEDWQRYVLHDAVIETFCLHLRQLEEFFTKKGVNSAQILSDRKYTAAVEPKFPDGVSFSAKLNNQMAHLMNNRPATDAEKIQGKDFEIMFRWVAEELTKFKQAVADPELKVRDVVLALIRPDSIKAEGQA